MYGGTIVCIDHEPEALGKRSKRTEEAETFAVIWAAEGILSENSDAVWAGIDRRRMAAELPSGHNSNGLEQTAKCAESRVSSIAGRRP
jgi:hypothetical protein